MLVRRVAIPLFIVCCLLSGPVAFGRIWTGAHSSSWSDGQNWNPVGVPQPLELNDFPSGAVNHVVNIDVPTGPIFGSQAFVGNYTVNGNRVNLNGGILTQGNLAWNADITCAGAVSFHAPDPGAQLTVAGAVDVNRQTITVYRASFTGAINGDGTIISPGADWPITISGSGDFHGTIKSGPNYECALVISGNLPNASVDYVASLSASGANPTLGPVNVGTLIPSADLGVLHTKNFHLDGTFGVAVRADGGSSVQVTGTANINGHLSIATYGMPPIGTHIKLVDNDGGDKTGGAFFGWPPFVANSVGSASYPINYSGGDGNDVDLMRAAELPTTTTLTQSSSQTAYQQTVTFNVTVSAASGTPGGFAGLIVDGVESYVPVQNGSAVFSTSSLRPGTHSIGAEYLDSPG